MSAIGLLSGYINRPTLAAELNCSERTIKRYEDQPDGLPSTIIGGRKMYRIAVVKDWLAGRERKPNPRRGG